MWWSIADGVVVSIAVSVIAILCVFPLGFSDCSVSFVLMITI